MTSKAQNFLSPKLLHSIVNSILDDPNHFGFTQLEELVRCIQNRSRFIDNEDDIIEGRGATRTFLKDISVIEGKHIAFFFELLVKKRFANLRNYLHAKDNEEDEEDIQDTTEKYILCLCQCIRIFLRDTHLQKLFAMLQSVISLASNFNEFADELLLKGPTTLSINTLVELASMVKKISGMEDSRHQRLLISESPQSVLIHKGVHETLVLLLGTTESALLHSVLCLFSFWCNTVLFNACATKKHYNSIGKRGRKAPLTIISTEIDTY